MQTGSALCEELPPRLRLKMLVHRYRYPRKPSRSYKKIECFKVQVPGCPPVPPWQAAWFRTGPSAPGPPGCPLPLPALQPPTGGATWGLPQHPGETPAQPLACPRSPLPSAEAGDTRRLCLADSWMKHYIISCSMHNKIITNALCRDFHMNITAAQNRWDQSECVWGLPDYSGWMETFESWNSWEMRDVCLRRESGLFWSPAFNYEFEWKHTLNPDGLWAWFGNSTFSTASRRLWRLLCSWHALDCMTRVRTSGSGPESTRHIIDTLSFDCRTYLER